MRRSYAPRREGPCGRSSCRCSQERQKSPWSYGSFNAKSRGRSSFMAGPLEIRLKTVLRSDRVGMVDREVDRSFDARQYWWILSHILSDPALLSVLVRAAQ